MSASSNYLENKLIEHTLRNVAYTSPTVVKIALFNSDPSTGSTLENLEANTITDECSGGAYARQTATFAAASNGACATSANVTFPAATDNNWGTITHVAVMEDSTDNVLFYGALDTAKLIESGDTFQITSGNLTVTIA